MTRFRIKHRPARRTSRVVCGILLFAGSVQTGGQELAEGRGAATTIPAAPAFSAEALVALAARDWLTHGGNLFNQRYSRLTGIDRDNVGELRGVWRTHLRGSGLEPRYSAEATPIVHEGVIYVSTGANDVFALSVESGRIIWQYAAELDAAINTVCCGWANRGVALGDGKVFVGQLDGRLVALDQLTGEPVWSIQAERWQDGFTITSAPLYYDGMIVGIRRRRSRHAREGQGLRRRRRIADLDLLYHPGSRRARS